MGKRPEAYLVADMGDRLLNLELQGVTLISQPVHKAVLNRKARDLISGRDRSEHLTAPYLLDSANWIESPRFKALRDSARISPDTTGALMHAIRTSPVIAQLEFDRGLTLILEGRRVDSVVRRWIARLSLSLRSLTEKGSGVDGSPETAEIRLLLSPADVRSLAPNIKTGSRFILVP